MNIKGNKILNILVLGGDLTSNTGIASVIKAHYFANSTSSEKVNFHLLKTTYYKDKNKFYKLICFFEAFFIFIRKIIWNKINLIHIHTSGGNSFYRSVFFILLGKLFRKKIILHIHSSTFYEFFLPKSKSKIKFIRKFFMMNEKVIVLCNDWKEKITAHYSIDEEHLIILHNPVIIPTNINTAKPNRNIFKVIFVGFFIESKGIRDILEIAKLLKANRNDNIKISLGGKGDMQSHIENNIKENKLENQIEIVGWIDKKEVHDTLSNYDLFFLPSYKEGMPISILEAMSVGLPILSTRIAGIPELVTDDFNGFLFSPGDIDNFYNKILWMKTNADSLKDYGKNSSLRIREFSSENIFHELIKIYDEIIETKLI